MTPPIPFADRTADEHDATARILAAITNRGDVPGAIAADLRAAREAERARCEDIARAWVSRVDLGDRHVGHELIVCLRDPSAKVGEEEGWR